MGQQIVAFAPGRVNLIGDHTDYCSGVALPMAIQLGVTARMVPGAGPGLEVSSSAYPGTFRLRSDGAGTPRVAEWVRYVSAVMEAPPSLGIPDGRLEVSGDLPAGAGLSSSAALSIAVALALGDRSDALDLSRREQAAEALVGIEVGLLDPLAITLGRRGSAVFLDFAAGTHRLVPLPPDMDIVVVHSGVSRELASSPYAQRRGECRAAESVIGPLGLAGSADLRSIRDPVLERRARHVVSEVARVKEMVEVLQAGDKRGAGMLLLEGHRSLRDDFEISDPVVDGLVDALASRPGVHGARMTGGGSGGCVVAFTEPGAIDVRSWPGKAWRVVPSAGARLLGAAGI